GGRVLGDPRAVVHLGRGAAPLSAQDRHSDSRSPDGHPGRGRDDPCAPGEAKPTLGMSPEALGLTMIALLVVAIMIGFPTAFTLMALGITFGFIGIGFVVFDLVVQRTFFVMQNDVLVAIPLFVSI